MNSFTLSLIDTLWVRSAGVWPAESAAYVAHISMWVCCSPTHRLCNSRRGAVGSKSLQLEGMEAVSSPEKRKKRVDPVKSLRTGYSLYFKTSSRGKKKREREKKDWFHPRGKYLHHLIRRVWNHNACQMNKWCCGMWKSVVFSENTHGPWRLIPQSCCLSKLPRPEVLSYNKSMFLLPRRPARFSSPKFMGCH